MRAIKIDVTNQTFTEIEIRNWEEIAPAIGNGCRIFACPVTFGNSDTLYIDDEGLYNPIIGGIIMDGWYYPIVGNVIILGSDDEGDQAPARSTVKWCEDNIMFVSKAVCEAWRDQVK